MTFPPLKGRSVSASPTRAGSTSGLAMTSGPGEVLESEPLPDRTICTSVEVWPKDLAAVSSRRMRLATQLMAVRFFRDIGLLLFITDFIPRILTRLGQNRAQLSTR